MRRLFSICNFSTPTISALCPTPPPSLLLTFSCVLSSLWLLLRKLTKLLTLQPQRPLRAFPAAQPQRDENQPMNAISNKPKNMDVQLAHPQNAIIGTIKGNAKRSAFGDLSNTTTTTGANANQRVPTNGLAKQAVIAAKPAVKMIPYNDNKENAVKDGVRKDAFLRPAQRPSNTQKASAAPASQPAVKLAGTRKATMVYSDQYQPRVPGLSRQYRSQPQLKSTEPPVLRRSHSKHILQNVRTNNADDDIDEASYEDAMEQQSCEEQTDVSAWMPAPGPMGPPVAAEMEPLQPAPALAPAPMHPLPSGPVDTQPEEYWEDDEAEEWYDDYGYSTAHSYKSHGDTTTGAITLNAPKKTARVQRELEHARCYVESTRSSEDTDEEEWDISMVAEYSEEIFEYMRELEVGDHHMSLHSPLLCSTDLGTRSGCCPIPTTWTRSSARSSGPCVPS